MNSVVRHLLRSSRVPASLPEQSFGLWGIYRTSCQHHVAGCSTMTVLTYMSMATAHLYGDTVMEDSLRELSRHLPILIAAKGRILITGLGLGCVVRGLLCKPEVEHVDVVEIDKSILRVIGIEFEDNPRVTLHHYDAFEFPILSKDRWDYAWHDLYHESSFELTKMHTSLMHRFCKNVGKQGAWMYDRRIARLWPIQLLGCPKRNQKL